MVILNLISCIEILLHIPARPGLKKFDISSPGIGCFADIELITTLLPNLFFLKIGTIFLLYLKILNNEY